jgi:hypothetical protein
VGVKKAQGEVHHGQAMRNGAHLLDRVHIGGYNVDDQLFINQHLHQELLPGPIILYH